MIMYNAGSEWELAPDISVHFISNKMKWTMVPFSCSWRLWMSSMCLKAQKANKWTFERSLFCLLTSNTIKMLHGQVNNTSVFCLQLVARPSIGQRNQLTQVLIELYSFINIFRRLQCFSFDFCHLWFTFKLQLTRSKINCLHVYSQFMGALLFEYRATCSRIVQRSQWMLIACLLA